MDRSESGLPKHGMRDFRPRTEPAGSSIYAGMISISLAFSFVRLANWCKLENSLRIRKVKVNLNLEYVKQFGIIFTEILAYLRTCTRTCISVCIIWSLIFYDARICSMYCFTSGLLSSIWHI